MRILRCYVSGIVSCHRPRCLARVSGCMMVASGMVTRVVLSGGSMGWYGSMAIVEAMEVGGMAIDEAVWMGGMAIDEAAV